MHAAHLSDEYVQMAKDKGTEHAMRMKFYEIKTMDMPKQLRAIAVQLEMGKETERIHIQGYFGVDLSAILELLWKVVRCDGDMFPDGQGWTR